jgi:prepilin-type N-terminal cleavage/methylation domain-containing protein
MTALKKASAFTLLELLIVIIIVGVLAAVALPALFQNVERSRATEALNTMGIILRQIDACGMQYDGNYAPCNTWDAIGMDDPSGPAKADAHFSYSFASLGIGRQFSIVAYRLTLDDGDINSNIVMERRVPGGPILRYGFGAFDGIQ